MEHQFIASLIVLALTGIVDSGYLYFHHLKKKPLFCPINGRGCNAVIESEYNKMFGIKNEILGILYYLFVIIASFLLFYQQSKFVLYLLVIISALALCASAYLAYIQKYIIRQYCFYCLISALINLLLFAGALLLL